jgi:hypothetical protein
MIPVLPLNAAAAAAAATAAVIVTSKQDECTYLTHSPAIKNIHRWRWYMGMSPSFVDGDASLLLLCYSLLLLFCYYYQQ